MKYRVTHATTYTYGETVPLCQNFVHLTPRKVPGQRCLYHRLLVRPTPSTTSRRLDYFGNPVTVSSVSRGHHRLLVRAISKLEVQPRAPLDLAHSPSWEAVRDGLALDRSRHGLDVYQFLFDSPHVARSTELKDYARPSFPPGRPLLAAVLDLTARIHAEFRYDPQATTIDTPVSEVLRQRRGVCQDLAHLQIGCLRSLGLAARYVSGYLRTHPPAGQPRLVGADASHAWLAVFCGPLDWIDLDPTNKLVPSDEHMTIAWGRDYSDVCPIQGMFVGGGRHAMTTAVEVLPLEEPR